MYRFTPGNFAALRLPSFLVLSSFLPQGLLCSSSHQRTAGKEETLVTRLTRQAISFSIYSLHKKCFSFRELRLAHQ